MTREEILSGIVKNEKITAAVLAVSKSHVENHPEKSMAAYFSTCAALATHLDEIDIVMKGPEGTQDNVSCLIPFVSISMPGFSDGFVANWAEDYCLSVDVEDEKQEDYILSNTLEGDKGTPNYIHGLMIIDMIGTTLAGLGGMAMLLASTQVMETEQTIITDNVPDIFSDIKAGKLH